MAETVLDMLIDAILEHGVAYRVHGDRGGENRDVSILMILLCGLKHVSFMWGPLVFNTVKLGIRTEMSGPKSCEALASTCKLRRSLAGCLKFWRSGRSRRVWSRAKKKLKRTRAS